MSPSAQPSGKSHRPPEPAAVQAGRAAVVVRLRRLQGQADGIARMIERERPVLEVLQQLAALVAAAREASIEYGAVVLREELSKHVDDPEEVDQALVQMRSVT